MKVLVNTNYVEQHLSTEDYNKMVVDVMVHELTHHEQNVLTQHIQNSHLESIRSDIELLNINYKSVYLQSSIVENTIYKAQPIEKEAFQVGIQYSKYLVGTAWKLKDLDNPFSQEDLNEWNELLGIQENILRNSAEITLMKNHKHQIILILENDPIAKYSAFKLALKHPENTTILNKDGNNIYGKSLDGIDGNIRITAVGHGNTFEDGTKTIGGQDVNTLLQTIQDLNGQLSDTTIKTVSLVGCNLGINHHIDNTDSYDYGKELIQKLHDNNLDPEVHVRNGYVGVTEDGQKVTRATVNQEWKNQDSDAKIVYQIVEGEVKTQEYNNEGKIVKYNGHSLGYEFDSYREAAMESGIPEHLIEEYRQLAVDKQSDMYFRFVNPLSTSLIENGYATKGLDVHGKSASDGFAAGFIPVDQNLSKMFGDISRLPKAFEDMQKSLDAGFQKVKLVLTESRIQELFEKGKISRVYAKFALPAVLTSILMISTYLVDGVLIGQFIG
ncbi:MAG: anthrax toxin-like adenylyl cyclase domain-containing protein, partial [Fusobacterium sp.]